MKTQYYIYRGTGRDIYKKVDEHLYMWKKEDNKWWGGCHQHLFHLEPITESEAFLELM